MSIRTLVEETATAESDGVEPLSDLLASLGWTPRVVVDRRGHQLLSVGVGEVPQILFVHVANGAVDPSTAVSLGYSHEAQLAVDWSSDRFALHPTQSWSQQPGDSPLAEVNALDLDGISSLLYSLGRSTYRRLEVPLFRRSLPDLLAERFANFRRELRDIDQWLSRPTTDPFVLFHQLLFARIYEDRHPNLTPSRVGDNLDGGMVANLNQLLDWYTGEFDSDLFEYSLDLASFPERALRSLTSSLVVPWESLNLDFSVAEEDLAGRLYESYLERAVVLEGLETQLFAFARFADLKRQAGAYYTPTPIARHLVRYNLGRWLEHNKPEKPGDVRIVDPACGSGAFLSAAYGDLLRYFTTFLGRELTPADRAKILEESIFGVDIDREALMLARLRLLEIADLGHGPLPRLQQNLVHGDALRHPSGIADESFDVVLTNPPFAGAKLAASIVDTAELRERFPSIGGTGSNLAYAFADLALDLLRQNGVAGFVLPRVALDGDSSTAFRQNITAARISSIVDLGSNLLFNNANAYVTLISVDKEPDQGTNANFVRIQDRNIFPEEVLETLQSTPTAHGYSVQTRRSKLADEANWSPFWLRWTIEIRPRIDIQFSELNGRESPQLVIGTQLGAQRRFTFEADEFDALGDETVSISGHSIPSKFAPLYVRGRNIRPFSIVGSPPHVVVPLLGEDVAVDALVRSLGGTPKSFRPGQLETLRGPKVLIRSLSGEPAAVADFDGSYMPAQGGAGVASLVPPTLTRDHLAATESLINSAFYQWFLQGLGHPKASAVQLMRHHYAALPWPVLQDTEIAQLSEASVAVRSTITSDDGLASTYWKLRRQLDDLVFSILKVPDEISEIVLAELWREP